jgi:hypothetical protein
VQRTRCTVPEAATMVACRAATFANTCSREESDAAYDRFHLPAPGNWVWAHGLIANWKPGHQETWVDFDLDDRAPLLFIRGRGSVPRSSCCIGAGRAVADEVTRVIIDQRGGRMPAVWRLHACRPERGAVWYGEDPVLAGLPTLAEFAAASRATT